ncbi:MAG: 2-amino-4-hydroxy-6-hydroxymethyldihydropteridine diphosphokinase [Saccharofermentanales bacterium]|jgi:2-amino-4-hydroxy-6-hydroxymethyldihydropteridine diphosphokinase
MAEAYLSLGSNQGDRLEHMQAAVLLLASEPTIEIVRVSSLYESEPWGFTEQANFFNAVIWIRTTLSPYDLLDICLKIERQQNRVRTMHWGPRTLDIDILTYDELRLDTKRLTLPHPRMQERDFVLVPLAEIKTGDRLERPGVKLIKKNWVNYADAKKTDLQENEATER